MRTSPFQARLFLDDSKIRLRKAKTIGILNFVQEASIGGLTVFAFPKLEPHLSGNSDGVLFMSNGTCRKTSFISVRSQC